MSLLEKMESNKPVAYGIIAVILLAAGALAMMNMRGPSRATSAWYYDLGTGELFPASLHDIPPIDTPSGEGKGVKATVMSCGGCGASERFIAWFETLTPEAKNVLKSYGPDPDPVAMADDTRSMQILSAGSLIAKPGDGEPRWIRKEAPEGNQIVREAMGRCGRKTPTVCAP